MPQIFSKTLKTKDGKMIEVILDKDLCIGAGSCAALASQTFGLDEKGIAFIIENNEYDTLEEILAGAQSCPVFAIKILDENKNQLWPIE